MRRRRLLASLSSLAGATALAGCSGRLAEESGGTTRTATTSRKTTKAAATTDPDSAETTDDPETTAADGDSEWPPRASVVELETGDRTLALNPTSYRSDDGASVSVAFAATATPDRPAQVRATLTNENDYDNTFRLNETPPFAEVNDARLRDRRGLTYRSNWYLVPTENHELVNEEPNYRRGPAGYWRLADRTVAPQLPPTVRLAPGETVEGEYVLLGQAEGEGRPTGSYEFRGYDDSSVTITAWTTSAPGPETESRFEGASPPALSEGMEAGTRWYHDAGPETPVYLEPSAERGRLPERIDFTLRNRADEPVTGNPYHWVLYKLHDGEWFHVAPWGWPAPMSSVPPGDTEDWTLYAFGSEAVDVDDGNTVGFLGGGRYAFEVGMSRGKHSHAALFELTGPSVAVEPTPGVESSRDGDTVTVNAPDPEHEWRPATLTVTRAANADDRLVAEQVMQRRFSALRDALALFESGVETVVVKTTRNAASRVVGYDRKRRRFRFDGQAYEATMTVASEE
ncbi:MULTISPECIES: hypothetical protein [Halorussus]|uniref:hypothetical protein n=1 Tax=Halorussus TaxID=1070314 RepID=UPI00209DBAEC|nr:hypothetical protein [Halorussus vallis]USZ74724.1 hypothetical protein NGM07_14920 [Halorussus vallis]